MVDGLRLGDRVTLRKKHPCGGYDWEVIRLGADVRILCLGCDRRVMLSRSELAKRVKAAIAPDGESIR